MAAGRTPREKWIQAGLAALAAGGPKAVRIENLAQTLGVTKGGFYGYFANREALLTQMLDTWERESIDDVLERVAALGTDPRAKIRLAGQLTLPSDRQSVDLAVRDWARGDREVAARLRRVDNSRMDLLRELFSSYCPDPEEVEARSLLAFCLAIGHHFLAADHPGRSRRAVTYRAANLILGLPMDTDPPPELS